MFSEVFALIMFDEILDRHLPMLPNSAKQAFAPRKFSKRSKVELLRTTTTTDAYLSFSVSAYRAVVKLYGLKMGKC